MTEQRNKEPSPKVKGKPGDARPGRSPQLFCAPSARRVASCPRPSAALARGEAQGRSRGQSPRPGTKRALCPGTRVHQPSPRAGSAAPPGAVRLSEAGRTAGLQPGVCEPCSPRSTPETSWPSAGPGRWEDRLSVHNLKGWLVCGAGVPDQLEGFEAQVPQPQDFSSGVPLGAHALCCCF